ncbi:hypothetical protein GCM10023330_11430 [Litoribaculum gwangyangense]|uniref:Tail specific protease domain-containing protein n=2 Tax=Litoribaculum gwangyangense TaxID=1130722 RepID=A0ABP9C9N0_9FLAO
MISDIEFYDAEMIATRNNNKEVSWQDYKGFHNEKWNKSVSPKELKQLFNEFRRGYLNGHSHLEFLHPIEKTNKTYTDLESTIKIGYTYPEISFYNVENGNKIVSINNIPIDEIFWNFSNYETTKIRPNAVLKNFSSSFNQRNLRVDGEMPKVISYEDQKKDSVFYNPVEPSSEDIFFDGIDLVGYEDWETIEKGYKVALLKKNGVALIKIKNFVYMKGFGGDVDCDEPIEEIADSTMCKDVKVLMRGLQSVKDNTDCLIFDLQDNLGGNENTPFVKMFCPAPFTDTRVQYRKTKLFEDPETRDALNYFNPKAENWYNSLRESGIYQQVSYGDFLPVRGDFCQGDDECGLGIIKPNNNLTSMFNKIIILTNHDTGSSADDFAFRFKEFGGAFIAGQPQSADLTYALISVLYYVDEQGNLDRVFYGNAQKKPSISGKELFKINIPYSKTIDKHGNMLQGNPMPMDLLVPITPENFDNVKRDVLNRAIEYYCN